MSAPDRTRNWLAVALLQEVRSEARCSLCALIMRWTPPADGIHVPSVEAMGLPRAREMSSMQLTTVGLDIAKNTFQVHGIG
jgi:hypothetical protein